VLIAVRHGRTAGNAAGRLLGRSDEPLDDHGARQASALAAALPAGAKVISSPLIRCRQTAEAIRADHLVDERLVELDYGELDQIPLSEVRAPIWKRWQADTSWAPPNGESLEELSARVAELLDEIAEESAPGDIVLVTHVSPIKAALAWALGVGIEVSWRCRVAQASIHRIAIDGPAPSLLSFNETGFLGDLR